MPLPDDYLPSRGFLRDYLRFGEKATDAPLNYHLACGLHIIGTILGNRVYLPRGAQRLFANQYTCLVGRARWDRKSTCVGLAEAVITAVAPDLLAPHEITPEALYERLVQQPVLAFYWREFTASLAAAQRTYMEGFIPLLTDLYDSRPRLHRALKAKAYDIRWPAPSILTASVAILLFGDMREREILGGFFPRFLYVFADAKPRSDPNPPELPEDELLRLADSLKPLLECQGPVHLGAATALHADFYRRTEKEAQAHPEGDLLAAFYGAADAICLKLALGFHYAQSTDPDLAPPAMEQAIAFCEYEKARLRQAIETELALSETEKRQQKILRVLRAKPGLTKGDLERFTHLSAKEIQDPLDTLKEQGLIMDQPSTRKGGYPIFFIAPLPQDD